MRAFIPALLALIWLGGAAASASDEEDFWQEMDRKLAAHGPEGFDTLSLGDSLLLATASNEEFGYLAVLDHGKARWSAHADPDAPACWRSTYERACQATSFGLLPAEAGGTTRFYIVADYYQAAGATRGHQLSFWRWKNGKAEAFYTTDFVTGGDAPQGVTVAGTEVAITGKGFWQHFSVCGACDGRQQSRHLRITPTGVEDLGVASLTPELDIIDALLGGAENLATPETAAMLKTSWHGNIFIIDPPVIGAHSVCLAPKDLPALTFRFAPDSKRIIAIEPGSCR